MNEIKGLARATDLSGSVKPDSGDEMKTYHVQFLRRPKSHAFDLTYLAALIAVAEYLDMEVGGTLDDLAVETRREIFNVWLSVALTLEPSFQIQFTEAADE